MNTDHLFQLFSNSIQHKSDDDIEKEILESAHYHAKMFMKYITNLKNFQLKLLYIVGKDSKKDVSKDKQIAEELGYAKAFSHVSCINLYDKNHINDLDLINPYDFAYCIQVTKKYFMQNEEYGKVAFLHELAEFVDERYESLQISE
jgi:hypothetical protein